MWDVLSDWLADKGPCRRVDEGDGRLEWDSVHRLGSDFERLPRLRVFLLLPIKFALSLLVVLVSRVLHRVCHQRKMNLISFTK